MSNDTNKKEPLYFDNTLTVLAPILIIALLGVILGLVFLG
jgi:hypothetical protein